MVWACVQVEWSNIGSCMSVCTLYICLCVCVCVYMPHCSPVGLCV